MAKRAEGCRFLHLAKRTTTGGLIAFETPIPLEGLEDISLTNNYAEGSAFSDNVQDTNIKKPSFIDIAITLRELSNELEAFIMGKKYVNGKKVTCVTDSAPSLALLYQQTNSDGTYTNRVLYNCTLARDEVSNTTTTDSISFDSVKLSGKAIPLADGNLDLTMESDDPGIDAEELAKFFEEVVLP
ncbi:major tail protein [Clostridium botulinum]|uniref:major tail protein n=1 Tax=Clostridium botulinum TaxID=1491 RepID=UPI0006A6FB82|nr:major tail protein [Clostridium botulinum]KAI3350149.1 hypothetical protein CIT18_04530 [Clostridium botulinum]KOM88963.1 hypothetical protein ACP51_04315 [Clostridium botulinum]KOR63529.1 hypothetical protein ADT22_03100 [Clostridium botulinum]MCS6111545.1 hypothetical protein [Clostridium botulinum]NFE10965.1 hypothetical protein [Clostridium botulinum]